MARRTHVTREVGGRWKAIWMTTGIKKKKNVKGKEKNPENGESVLASFQTEIQGVVTGTLLSTEDAQSETRKTRDKVKIKQRKSARLTLMHLTSPTSAL